MIDGDVFFKILNADDVIFKVCSNFLYQWSPEYTITLNGLLSRTFMEYRWTISKVIIKKHPNDICLTCFPIHQNLEVVMCS